MKTEIENIENIAQLIVDYGEIMSNSFCKIKGTEILIELEKIKQHELSNV